MSDITRDYSFGGLLRTFRVDKGFTLRGAAKKLGMDPGNLSKLERSELDPPGSKKRIRHICNRLALNENQLSLLASMAFQHHIALLKERFNNTRE